METLFYKALRGFLKAILIVLLILKVVKMLIFQGFTELGIELKMGVEVWKQQICPFRQSNICSKM